MKQHILLLDLKDEESLIAEYEKHHREVWPEVLTHIKQCGIQNMRIFRYANRLVMLIDVEEHFSFEKMAELGDNNPVIQAWETLMNRYQKPLDSAGHGEKWLLATQIFELLTA